MEILERRILAAEKRLRRLQSNPAPTVPNYEMGATTPPPPPGVIIVAAGTDHLSTTTRVMTSVDGVDWVYATDPSMDGNYSYDVAWNGSIWVVACDANFLTSPDGVTWTSRDAPFFGGSGFGSSFGVVWCDSLNLFVAVGNTHGGFSNPPIVNTSPDGITWTPRATPWDSVGGFTGAANSVDWSHELGQILICGLSPNADHSFLSSADGITWTELTASGVDGGAGMNAATWSSDLGFWIASGVTFDGKSLAKSTDGTTWSTIGPLGGSGNDIVWISDLGIFVAAVSGPVVRTSPDGTTWTNHIFTGSDIIAFGVTYSPSLGLIIVQTTDKGLRTSSDSGVTWDSIFTGFNGQKILARA